MSERPKLYKLKHKPTGLYFQPSRGNGNLSKKGKVYIDRKPDVTWGHVLRVYPQTGSGVANIVKQHWQLDDAEYRNSTRYVKTKTEDWEIEEL